MKTKLTARVLPILFQGLMVQEILNEIENPGTGKTQTRRALSPENIRFMRGGINEPIVKYKPSRECLSEALANARNMRFIEHVLTWDCAGGSYVMANLTYEVGDVLWVRETWCRGPVGRDGVVDDWSDFLYRASNPEIEGIDDGDGYAELNADGSLKSCWKPSSHMTRKASRITLEVTDVRVERLQNISEEDALAEGVTRVRDHCYVIRGFDYDTAGLCHSSAITPYAKLWEHINGPDAWEANPFVVAITFRPYLMNVDAFLMQMEAA
jgi:hypothetical protein